MRKRNVRDENNLTLYMMFKHKKELTAYYSSYKFHRHTMK